MFLVFFSFFFFWSISTIHSPSSQVICNLATNYSLSNRLLQCISPWFIQMSGTAVFVPLMYSCPTLVPRRGPPSFQRAGREGGNGFPSLCLTAEPRSCFPESLCGDSLVIGGYHHARMCFGEKAFSPFKEGRQLGNVEATSRHRLPQTITDNGRNESQCMPVLCTRLLPYLSSLSFNLMVSFQHCSWGHWPRQCLGAIKGWVVHLSKGIINWEEQVSRNLVQPLNVQRGEMPWSELHSWLMAG